MAGKDPARSKRLRAELWAPRVNEADDARSRAIVLFDMARARLADDDPLWRSLVSELSRYLDSKQ
ncbi:hypothetical protein ACH4U7_30375 [Streptomyces sp. NPDC020845]|uniref:hypothetical protein n=1 Tax=Streptomyces sp. NPDC020845 TaxID=3365096 RepID=UPI0037AFAFA6